jgi:hypothetical protein
MWEWRIFLKIGKRKTYSFPSHIESLLKSAPIEQRTDYYCNLFEPTFGLKLRDVTSINHGSAILELKILTRKKKWGGEFWKKAFQRRLTYESISNDKIINDIKQVLQKQSYFHNNTEISKQLLDSFNSHKSLSLVPLTKKRQQIKGFYDDSQSPKWNFKQDFSRPATPSRNDLLINLEETIVNYNHSLWISIAFESSDAKVLKKFKKKFFSGEDFLNTSYPQFLLEQG